MPTKNDLGKLNPIPQAKARLAIDRLDQLNIKYFISETYRSQAVQDAYYAQGRKPLEVTNALRVKAGLPVIVESTNKEIITHAMVSKHTSGKALDVYPTDSKGNVLWNAPALSFKPIADVFKSFGFEWGGDWTKKDENGKVFKDWPHLEYNEVL